MAPVGASVWRNAPHLVRTVACADAGHNAKERCCKEVAMQPIELTLADFVGGLGFAEAPRWYNGALWVSDMAERAVLRIDVSGRVAVATRTPGEPSGLGWLPDRTLLIVQMEEHEIWRWNGAKLRRYTGTAPISSVKLNDMVVDANGRAWVSNFGYDWEKEPPRPTNLVCVDPGGNSWIAADNLVFPNGMAIDATGERLIVGQSGSPEIIEFQIRAKGVLDKRKVFGTLPGKAVSDGLCMDAEGALWIASPSTSEFLRMQPGGTITHRIATGERHAIACVLGGRDRRTLYAITAGTLNLRAARQQKDSRIGWVTVDVPGAGIP
jgi:sugar lactone lactonase YvrE